MLFTVSYRGFSINRACKRMKLKEYKFVLCVALSKNRIVSWRIQGNMIYELHELSNR